MNNNPNVQPAFSHNARGIAFSKYNTTRTNLLLLVVFSIINIILAATGSETYFLFSAIIPYFCSILGFQFAAAYGVTAIAIIFAAVAVVLLVPYVLCFIFSKKHYGWLIGALVYFALDSILLLLLFTFEVSMLLDYLFHAWVIISLITGIVNGKKLKEMPAEAPLTDFTVDEEGNFVPPDTEPLRTAFSEEKVKVYAQADAYGHHIVYRKYGKGLEELVVDGYVYAEFRFKGLAKPHFMSAVVGGHKIAAGYHQANYIFVDEVTVAQSVRWI